MVKGTRKLGLHKTISGRSSGASSPRMMDTPAEMKAGPLEDTSAMMGMKKGGAVKKGFSTKGGRGGVAKKGLGQATKGFKKGGAVKGKTWGSTEDIMGTGPSPAAAKADYAKKMKAAGLTPKLAKGGVAKKPKGGIGIMIILGKKGK